MDWIINFIPLIFSLVNIYHRVLIHKAKLIRKVPMRALLILMARTVMMKMMSQLGNLVGLVIKETGHFLILMVPNEAKSRMVPVFGHSNASGAGTCSCLTDHIVQSDIKLIDVEVYGLFNGQRCASIGSKNHSNAVTSSAISNLRARRSRKTNENLSNQALVHVQ